MKEGEVRPTLLAQSGTTMGLRSLPLTTMKKSTSSTLQVKAPPPQMPSKSTRVTETVPQVKVMEFIVWDLGQEKVLVFCFKLIQFIQFIHNISFVTVKGVNFYGPESEFIVSGSDCGE